MLHVAVLFMGKVIYALKNDQKMIPLKFFNAIFNSQPI
jgi:hypothetical protein